MDSVENVGDVVVGIFLTFFGVRPGISDRIGGLLIGALSGWIIAREALVIWMPDFGGSELTFACVGAAIVLAIFFALVTRGAHFMCAGFIGLQFCYYIFLLIFSASRYVLTDLDETSISLTTALFLAFVVTLLSGRYPRFISVLLTMAGSMLLFDGIAFFLGIETFKPYGLMIHGTYYKGECFDTSGRQLTLCVFFWGAQIVVGLFGLVIQYFTKRFYTELNSRFRGTFNFVRERVGLPTEEEAPEVGEFFEGQKAAVVDDDDEDRDDDITPTLETTPLLEDRKVVFAEELPYTTFYRILVFVILIDAVFYMGWMILYGRNLRAPVCAVLYLIAECITMPLGLIFYMNMWKPIKRTCMSLANSGCHQLPNVDVCITHCKEAVPVLEKTLRAVLNLDYPGEQMSVNILPDGFYGKGNKSVEIFQMVRKVLQEEATKLRQGRSRSKTYIDARITSCRIQLLKTAPDPDERKMREYLEQLMEDLEEKPQYSLSRTLQDGECAWASVHFVVETNVPYHAVNIVARAQKPKVNHHFKAGNIMNFLHNANWENPAQFISFFDKDQRPKAEFLQKTLTFWFADDKGYLTTAPREDLGFVQTPQWFGNIMYNDPLGAANSMFFLAIQVGRNGFFSCAFAGTNVVFLREALDEVGGLAYGTVTEDSLTGCRLQAKGYKSIYSSDILAIGDAPESPAEAMQQLKRWVKGATQILLMNLFCEPTLTSPNDSGKHPDQGLNFVQRIFFLDSTLYPFSYIAAILYIGVAIVFLVGGQAPLSAERYTLMYTFVPLYTLRFLANLLASQDVSFQDMWRAQQVWFCFAFSSVIGVVEAFYLKVSGQWNVNWGNSKGDSWGTGSAAEVMTSWLEWGNVIMVISLIAGVVYRLIRYTLNPGNGEEWEAASAIIFALYIAVQLWPMASLSLKYRGVNMGLPTYLLSFVLLVGSIVLLSIGSIKQGGG